MGMVNEISDKSPAALRRLYLGERNSWIRTNMVLTLDGNFVDSLDSSRGLSCEADLRLLLMLRAISDVVLIGAATARKENYPIPRLRKEHLNFSQKAPTLCVVSKSLDLSVNLKMFQNCDDKPIVITQIDQGKSWNENLDRIADLAEIVILDGPITGQKISDSLRELQFHNIVCEGGPSLIALLQKDALIDEMDITYAPEISGELPTRPALGTSHTKWLCTSVLRENDHMFTRFIRSPNSSKTNSVEL